MHAREDFFLFFCRHKGIIFCNSIKNVLLNPTAAIGIKRKSKLIPDELKHKQKNCRKKNDHPQKDLLKPFIP